jgi:SAM-dependent methyltransferase
LAEDRLMSSTDYLELNRAGWDRRALAHFESRFYDVPGFLAGASSLREIELAELGDVAGKRMLHLQCHFGLDTLSWVRRGATCTGADLSPESIRLARELATQAGLEAEFVCSDVYGFRRAEAAPYDIVFTSYGAICWLPDPDRWAAVIAENLAPGGIFYMVEFHPIYDLLAGYSYFTRPEPDIDEEGTYTENGADAIARLATWAHPLSSVVNALLGAGIRIERLNEFPFSPYDCFPGLVEKEPRRFYLEHGGQDVPLVYSVTGRRCRVGGDGT